MRGAKVSPISNTAASGGKQHSSEQSPVSASGTKSVSFSSQVSVFQSMGDDSTIATITQELAEATEHKHVTPSSLFSGRWIENALESNETRGVAVVEVTDTSPLSMNSCSGERRQQSDTANAVRTQPASKDMPNRFRIRKRLLQRDESPLQKNASEPTVPALLKSQATLSSFAPQHLDTTDSNLSPLTNSCTSNASSPLGNTFDLGLLNSGLLGMDPENLLESEVDDIRPLSRRGKMWARIVNTLRALLAFFGYSLVVANKLSCRENEREIVSFKFCGAFVLCCLSSLATRDQGRRMGWKKLFEIVCSRKTFLLLSYIVAWSYIVNTAAGLWNERLLGDTTLCPERERPSFPTKAHEWFLPADSERQQQFGFHDVKVTHTISDISTISPEIALVLEPREEIPSLDSGTMTLDGSSRLDPCTITPETRPALEPQTLPGDSDEKRGTSMSNDNRNLDQDTVVRVEADDVVLSPETRQAREPHIRPVAVDEGGAASEEKASISIGDTNVTNTVAEEDAVATDSRSAARSTTEEESIDSRNDEIHHHTFDIHEPVYANETEHVMRNDDFLIFDTNDGGTKWRDDGNLKKEVTVEGSNEPAVADDDTEGTYTSAIPSFLSKTITEFHHGGRTKTNEFTEKVGVRQTKAPLETEIAEMTAETQDSQHVGSTLPTARVQEYLSRRVPSMKSINTPVLTKSQLKEAMTEMSSVFSLTDTLCKEIETQGIEMCACNAGIAKDEKNARLEAIDKALMLARFLRRHCKSFLIGENGSYKNQWMMDVLYDVWTRRLLA